MCVRRASSRRARLLPRRHAASRAPARAPLRRRADAQWTGRACQKDGIAYELREYADAAELDSALKAANDDPDVHGVLIYYPCFGFQPSFFGGSMDDQLRDSVSTEKDVEGLTHTYRAHLYRDVRVMPGSGGVKCLLPCTPLAVVKILEQLGAYDTAAPTGRQLAGKTVTVVNRSEIVGRPLAALLANDGAAIYSVDIDSIYEARATPTRALLSRVARRPPPLPLTAATLSRARASRCAAGA